MNKFKGFLYGMTASATFGLLPLFTLPTMAEGMTTDSILCYRMLFASLLVAVLMMVRRVNFFVGVRELSSFHRIYDGKHLRNFFVGVRELS